MAILETEGIKVEFSENSIDEIQSGKRAHVDNSDFYAAEYFGGVDFGVGTRSVCGCVDIFVADYKRSTSFKVYKGWRLILIRENSRGLKGIEG